MALPASNQLGELVEDTTLLRYAPPTKYIEAPLGSICKVMSDNNEHTYYVQIAAEVEHPHWVKAGDFLERTFIDYIKSQEFVTACIGLASCDPEEKHIYLEALVGALRIQ